MKVIAMSRENKGGTMCDIHRRLVMTVWIELQVQWIRITGLG